MFRFIALSLYIYVRILDTNTAYDDKNKIRLLLVHVDKSMRGNGLQFILRHYNLWMNDITLQGERLHLLRYLCQ